MNLAKFQDTTSKYKNLLSSYILNKSKTKFKENNSTNNNLKNTEYLDINLRREEQDLNTESCNAMLRDIKNPFSPLEDSVLLRILPKLLQRFNTTQSKYQQKFVIEIDKLNLKLTAKCKGLTIAKTTWKKRKKVKRPTLSDFKT